MRDVCLVNGSSRCEKASSLSFLRDVQKRLDKAGLATALTTVLVRPTERYPQERLRAMAESGAIVLCFPLYLYTTPGALTKLLEEYYEFVRTSAVHNGRPKLYSIINCGFPQPVVFEEAIRVIRNFAARTCLDYRFSVAVTAGAVTAITKKVPLLHPRLKRAYADIVRDLSGRTSKAARDVFVKPVLPKRLIIWVKDQYEKKMV